MLLVLLGIAIILAIIFIILIIFGNRNDSESLMAVGIGFLILDLFCVLVIVCFIIGTCFEMKQSSYIPNKISILENENSKMEEDINSAIQKYCEYEHKTYTELKPNEINFVFILYPELKSSELVVSYIDTITQNRNEIKELKLEYEDSKVYKWWVYFGG